MNLRKTLIAEEQCKELITKIDNRLKQKNLGAQCEICAVEAVYSKNASNLPFLESMQFHYKTVPTEEPNTAFTFPDNNFIKSKKFKLFAVFTTEDLTKIISSSTGQKENMDEEERFELTEAIVETIVKHIFLLIEKIKKILDDIKSKINEFATLKGKTIKFIRNAKIATYVVLDRDELKINCFKLFDSEFDDDGNIEKKLKKIYCELESLSKTLETQGETTATTPPPSLVACVPYTKEGTDTDTDDSSGWTSETDSEDSDTIEQKIKELADKGPKSEEQLREFSTKLKAKHTFSVEDILQALELFNSDKNYEENDIIKIFEIKHKLKLKNLDDAIKLFEATKEDGGPLQKLGYGMINTAADFAGTSIEKAIDSITRISNEHKNDATTTAAFLSVGDTFRWSKQFGISEGDAMKLSLAIRSKEFQSIIKEAPASMAQKTKTMDLKNVASVASAIIDLKLDAGKQTKKALSIIVYLEENKNCNLNDAIKVLKHLMNSQTIDWTNINNTGIDKAYEKVFKKEITENQEAADALKETLKKRQELNASSDGESSESDDDWL